MWFGKCIYFPFKRKKKLKVVGSPYWMAPEVLRHDQYNETVSRMGHGGNKLLPKDSR